MKAEESSCICCVVVEINAVFLSLGLASVEQNTV